MEIKMIIGIAVIVTILTAASIYSIIKNPHRTSTKKPRFDKYLGIK